MSSDLNVLIVDDEQIVLDSAERHLRQDDHKVFKVLSAQEGLDLFDSEDIHIVLTDLMMPEMDGLEFISVLKKKHPQVPVIMITGYATINTALQAMQLGAFDYVAKPFTKSELRGVVERAAHVAGNAGKAAAAPPEVKGRGETEKDPKAFKGIAGQTWLMKQEDDLVLIGVERPFLTMLGRIQTVDLPAKGDELRQGSVCFQIFTADLRSHVLWSPLSGTVVEVNQKVLDDPEKALEDCYGEGWLLRIKPSSFERDVEAIGL